MSKADCLSDNCSYDRFSVRLFDRTIVRKSFHFDILSVQISSADVPGPITPRTTISCNEETLLTSSSLSPAAGTTL
jgi:hypothetical protein